VRHDIVQCFILVYSVCDVCDRKFSALECKMLLSIVKSIHRLFTAHIVTGS